MIQIIHCAPPFLLSDRSPKELFDEARDRLLNPVKRTIFVPKAEINEDLLLSGYTALSEYSMINPPAVEYYAADSVTAWEKESSTRLHDPEDECAVELWRYNPRKLASGGCVDRLSLSLALCSDSDERIEDSVDEMLAGVWSEIASQEQPDPGKVLRCKGYGCV
jgi:hypothetical protein